MEKSGFFGSEGGDRIYPSGDWSGFFTNFITNGIFNNSCRVVANDDMSVTLTEGWAMINGYWYHNKSPKILDVTMSDSNQSRIDNVVLRYTAENREIIGQIVDGSYATNPTAPSLQRSASMHDLRLAKISIPIGADKITQDMIEDCRFNSDDCGNVVQAVQHLDTTNIFSQYETYFKTWFKNLQDQLDENQASKLQKQINDINDNLIVIDTCTDEELAAAIAASD